MEVWICIIPFMVLLDISVSLEVTNPAQIRGIYYHLDAHFGKKIDHLTNTYDLVLASPDLSGCTPLPPNSLQNTVALMLRGSSIINGTIYPLDIPCRFTTKVRHAQQAGAVAAIIGNNVAEHDIVPMYDNTDTDNSDLEEITISSMSISHDTFRILNNFIVRGEKVQVKINDNGLLDPTMIDSAIQRWITAILSTLMLLASVSLIVAAILSLRVLIIRLRNIWQARQRRLRINTIPTIKYSSNLIIAKDRLLVTTNTEKSTVIDEYDDSEDDELKHQNEHPISAGNIMYDHSNLINEEQIKLMDEMTKSDIEALHESHSNGTNMSLHNETCNVCLEDFKEGEKIKLLRCKHGFHDKCINTWIVKKGKCPVCIRDVFEPSVHETNGNDDEDTDYDLYLSRI